MQINKKEIANGPLTTKKKNRVIVMSHPLVIFCFIVTKNYIQYIHEDKRITLTLTVQEFHSNIHVI